MKYDLVIKGGRVVDPYQGIDGDCDIAIRGDSVAAVEQTIDAGQATQVIDACGKLVPVLTLRGEKQYAANHDRHHHHHHH